MSSNIFEDDGTSSVMSAMPSVLQPQHTAPGYEQPHLQPQPQVMSLSFAPRFASSTPAPRSPQRTLAPQRPAPSMALNTTAAAALQRPAAAVPAGGSSSSPFVAAAGGEGGNSGLATAAAPMIAVASRPAERTGAEAPADVDLQGAEPPAPWRRRDRLLLAPPPPAPVLLPPTPLPPPAPAAAAQVKADGTIPDSPEPSPQQPQEQQKHRPQLGRPPTFGELFPVLNDSGSFTAASHAARVGPGAGALTAPGSTTSPGAAYTVAEGAPTSRADAGPGVPGSPAYGCSAGVLVDSAAAAHASATAITSRSRSRGFMLPMPPSAASAIPRPPAAAATSSGGATAGVCSGVQSSPEGEATMRLLRRSLAAGDVQQVRYTDAASGAFLHLIAAGTRPEAAGTRLPLSLIAPGVEPAPDVDKGAPGLLRPAPSAPPIGEDTLSPRAASSQSTGAGRVLESLPAGRMPGCGSHSRPASGFAWTSGGRWSPGGDLNSVMSRFQRLSHGSHLQQQLQQQQQQQQQHTPQTLTGVHTSKQRVASIPNSGGGSRSLGVVSRLLAGAAAVRATSGGTLISHAAADGAGRLLSGATPNALVASVGSPSSPSARTTASEAWRHPVAQPPLLSTASPGPGRGHHLRVPLQGAAGGSGGGLGSLEAHSSRQHYAQASGGRRLPIKAPSAAFLGSTTLGNAVGKTRRALRKTSSAAKLLIRTAAGTPGQLQVLDTAKVLMQGPTTRANAGTAFVVGSPPAASGLPSATGVGSPMQGPSVAGMSGAAAGVGGGGPPSTSSVRMRVSMPGSTRGAASLAAGSSAGGGMDAAVSAVLAADATTFGELLRLQWCVPSVPPAAAADGRMISLQQQRRRSIGGLTGGAATEPPVKLTPDVGAVTDGMQQVHSSANPGWTAERLSAAAVDAVRMVANVVSPRISLDRPREPLPALPAPSQKSVQAHQSRQSQAGTQRAAAAAAGAAVVFRGIRVRMGLHSHVTTPADLTRNDACGRVQYSGSLLRLAKAVSDVGQGGMVLLSQAARDALQQAAEGESAAALQKALGGPFVLLWMGRHTFADGAVDAHLYQVVSMPLVGRLALQLQQSGQALLRKCAPVPPLGGGVFDAPAAGFGTLARISVVGASTLMAWNVEVTTRALAQMHEMLLGHLTCCTRATCNAVVEEEESSGPDGGVRARVASNNLASCYIVEGAEGLLGSGKSLGRGGRSITAKQKSIFAVSPSPPKGKESMHTQLPPQSGPSTNGRHASSAMQAHSITAANGNAGGLGASSGNTLSGEDARVPSRTALSMSAPSWLHKGSQQQPRASFTAALRQKLRMHITANSNSSPGASPGPGTTPVGSVAALRSDLAVSTSAATAVAAPSSHTKLLPKHSVPGAMTAAWRNGPAQAVHWLLSCLSSLPQMDW